MSDFITLLSDPITIAILLFILTFFTFLAATRL